MQIINDDMREQVLTHYPEQYHDLLKKQILVMEEIINTNIMKYRFSSDYREALDSVLTDILNGKFLGRD